VRDLDGLVGTLLAEHDNLWIDLSWSVLEPYILDDDGQVDRDWRALILAHPDRFLIGSDLVGKFDRLGESLAEFEPLLAALPDEVAAGVAGDNLWALLPERVRQARDAE
jgi:FAD/FMN-containing dehydrogenase